VRLAGVSRDARALLLVPLERAAFAPFGEVIAPDERLPHYDINAGTAHRYHALATAEALGAGARTVLSRLRAEPRALPFEVAMLERHPHGSQAFVPLDPGIRFVVVVSESPEAAPRAFLAERGAGVNYRRGTWHHPLIVLDRPGDFLVVDRDGPGDNCEEVRLQPSWLLTL
jgi:ureidoglycolate lyase